jgi:flagellar motor switch protein FliM
MSDVAEDPQVEDLAKPVTSTGRFLSVFSPEGHVRDMDSSAVTTYNFRQPGFLSQKDTSQLAALHQKYVASLVAKLATFLRMDISCEKKSVRCASLPFKGFCESIQQPTHLSVFQVSGLDGAGVLEIRPKTSIAIANRLLGGQGVATDGAERNPTEIEIALLDDVVMMVLREWCSMFERTPALKPTIVGHETSTRFLQIAADETPCFVFRADISVGNLKEQLQIGVPFSMMDGITHETGLGGKTTPEIKQKPLHWRSPYATIEVPILAEWDIREITLGEAASISPGDLIHVPQDLIDQTRLKISETEEFFGTIGVEEGRLAVHLNERITKE